MFPQENEYESFLSKNAHGSPNFDKAACTRLELLGKRFAKISPRGTFFVFIVNPDTPGSTQVY